jgi:hypothetical protein
MRTLWRDYRWERDIEEFNLQPVNGRVKVLIRGQRYEVLRQGPMAADGTAMVVVRYGAYRPIVTQLEVTW